MNQGNHNYRGRMTPARRRTNVVLFVVLMVLLAGTGLLSWMNSNPWWLMIFVAAMIPAGILTEEPETPVRNWPYAILYGALNLISPVVFFLICAGIVAVIQRLVG